MLGLPDLILSTSSMAAGTVVGAVLAAIEGVSSTLDVPFMRSADFSEARNGEYLE